ncbi:PREDICTED: testis-expressed sequence 22 protein [Condylura cristata]|uniref:testis-expressed sequence 22 protein n=1 Tax=Condylura cristata TaxID=143302 RepID=UPI000334325B|nr:PREDICTED: testis-expressed sequence 22 protein [Condylura cristata]
MGHILKSRCVGGAESSPPPPAAEPPPARRPEEALGTGPEGDRQQPVGLDVDRGAPLGRQPPWGAEQPGAWASTRTSQPGPLTQDWVCEPPPSGSPRRHWSLSIEERRQLALQGEKQGSALADTQQLVAGLVSVDVCRDALLPHPLRASGPNNAFRAFLARSAPFWQKMALEAPRSPPP